MSNLKFFLSSIEETKKLAIALAQVANPPLNIILSGDLGAGKTTFTKYFINSKLQKEEEVPSPTYNLMQIYQNKELTINHYDIYRINNMEEIYDIEIFENLFKNCINIIEWGEKLTLKNIKNLVKITFHFQEDNAREVTIETTKDSIKNIKYGK